MLMSKNAKSISPNKKNVTKSKLKERILAKLSSRGILNPKAASDSQLYSAVVLTVKEIMLEYRDDFKKRIKAFCSQGGCGALGTIPIGYCCA